MFHYPPERRIFPVILGTALLLVLLVAALAPNAGALPAQTNCPYGVCPAPSMMNSNLGWEVLLGLLVLIAIILAILIMRNRGRRQGTAPPEEWEAPAGAAAATIPPEPGAGAATVVAAPYLEQPEDVSSPPPSVTVVPAATGAAAVVGADAGEADIDSLMQELDKISGEILQRGTPPKKGQPPASGSGDETDKSA